MLHSFPSPSNHAGKNVQGESDARELRESTILFLFALYICKTPAVLTRIPLSKEETEKNASQARRYHTQSSNKNIRQGDIW